MPKVRYYLKDIETVRNVESKPGTKENKLISQSKRISRELSLLQFS